MSTINYMFLHDFHHFVLVHKMASCMPLRACRQRQKRANHKVGMSASFETYSKALSAATPLDVTLGAQNTGGADGSTTKSLKKTFLAAPKYCVAEAQSIAAEIEQYVRCIATTRDFADNAIGLSTPRALPRL